MKVINTEVCVIGAGAGGIGCVYRLIKNGIKTAVVDTNANFGGTMVFGGVDGFEPGVSLDGIHQLLAKELYQMKNACYTISPYPNCNLFEKENGEDWSNHSFAKYPWGLGLPNGKDYKDTLYRNTSYGVPYIKQSRFQFEYDKMITATNNVLSPYKDNLTTFFGYSFKSANVCKGKVLSVIIENNGENVEIQAKYFVDCSGDIVLARNVGCEYSFGEDASSLQSFGILTLSKTC